MSIQMTLVFGVLLVEMAGLILLLLPLPYVVRTKILDASAFLKRNNNVKVGVVFLGLLMGLQFLDCVRKVQRYAQTENPYFAQYNTAQQMSAGLLHDQLALKFYAQRNLYITGAVLYLALSINTVESILRKLVSKEAAYRAGKKLTAADTTRDEEVESLRALIKQREMDIEAMKKQLNGVQTAYDALSAPEARSKDD